VVVPAQYQCAALAVLAFELLELDSLDYRALVDTQQPTP